MMITLIRTPIVHPKHHTTSNRPIPHVGLAYINAVLTEDGNTVHIIDAAGEGIHQFSEINGTNLVINGINADAIIGLISSDTQLIGISCMHTNKWIYDSYIIKKVKRAFPNVKIILGGEHASGDSKRILETMSEVDLCILGEGEDTIIEVVKHLRDGLSIDNISGVAFINDDGDYVQNKRRPRIKDPDKIPFPLWDGFPMDNYFMAKSGIASFSCRSMPVVASRGCPYSCKFCTCKNMWDSKRFIRSPRNVIDEIKQLVEKYRVNHIDFLDLTFASGKKWNTEFCDLLESEKLNITWALPIGTRIENLDRELLFRFKKSGLNRILYSPESGSKSTLGKIEKKLDLKKFNQIVKASVSAGIIVKFAIISGFPGQTKWEVFQTVLFVIKAAFNGVSDIVCLAFVPYPGTDFYRELVDDGKLIPEDYKISLSNDLRDMKSWSEHLTARPMPFISVGTMFIFYFLQYVFRPWRFLATVWRLFILKTPVTTLETILYYFMFRYKLKCNSEPAATTK